MVISNLKNETKKQQQKKPIKQTKSPITKQSKKQANKRKNIKRNPQNNKNKKQHGLPSVELRKTIWGPVQVKPRQRGSLIRKKV